MSDDMLRQKESLTYQLAEDGMIITIRNLLHVITWPTGYTGRGVGAAIRRPRAVNCNWLEFPHIKIESEYHSSPVKDFSFAASLARCHTRCHSWIEEWHINVDSKPKIL